MSNKEITHVCLVETVYTLFLYMLLVEEEDYEHTFFFCSSLLPAEIKKKLPQSHCFKLPHKRYHKWIFRILLYYTSALRWPFIRRCTIYGSDNYLFSSGIIRNNRLNLLEDGTSNYSLTYVDPKLYTLRSWLMGSIAACGCGGRAPNVEKIYLTGLLSIPEEIRSKVELFSVRDHWEKLTVTYQRKILSLFDISIDVIRDLRRYTDVLFTQPMYEDGLLIKEEEIALYKQLLSNSNKCKLVIEVHPRDKMDYRDLFPDAYILKTKVPMELLSILGVQFKEVYTVFSTAALSLPYKANIHFMGTSVHPNLVKHRGIIEYDDCFF